MAPLASLPEKSSKTVKRSKPLPTKSWPPFGCSAAFRGKGAKRAKTCGGTLTVFGTLAFSLDPLLLCELISCRPARLLCRALPRRGGGEDPCSRVSQISWVARDVY